MFIFDCECHMMPLASDLKYFPLYKQNQTAVTNLVRRLEPTSVYRIKELASFEETRRRRKRSAGRLPGESADFLIRGMDEVGVQMACILPESMLPMSFGALMESTNGWVAKEIEKYPNRLIGEGE